MKKNHYYLASRVPVRGGLIMLRTDNDFPEAYKAEIEENCLEIYVPEYNNNAVMIYPLENGSMVTAFAKKVGSSRWETRVHENIHGYVMNVEDFSSQLLPQLLSKQFEDHCCDWKVEEVSDLNEETLYFKNVQEKIEEYENFIDSLNDEKKIKFFCSIYKVIVTKEKVHLIVPEELIRTVQKACYEILPYSFRNKLCTVSNGECTQIAADIILSGEVQLQYQDPRKYKRMNLETFFQWGSEYEKEHFSYFRQFLLKKTEELNEFYKYIENFEEDLDVTKPEELMEIVDVLADIFENMKGRESCNPRLIRRFKRLRSSKVKSALRRRYPCFSQENLEKMQKRRKEKEMDTEVKRRGEKDTDEKIEMCLNCLRSRDPIKIIFQDVRKYYHDKEESDWIKFQNKLRHELEFVPLLSERKEKYVSLLFLVYENYNGQVTRSNREVLSAPYDLEGMLRFLKSKAASEREYMKYVEEIFRQWNEIFTIYIPEKKVKSVWKRIRLGIESCLEDVSKN